MTRMMLPVSVLSFALAVGGAVLAQDAGWTVPEDAKAMPNPVPASAEIVAEGQALYEGNCQKCHGESGRGDGPATKFIRPAPADISTSDAQDRMTDGELFYKITEGKRPMPPMGTTLSEEERWKIVHFVRSLRQP